MVEWFTKSFQEFSILWLLFSSVIGGLIGASLKFVFDNLLPEKLTKKREILTIKRKYSTPILLAADNLRKRLVNIIKYIDRIEKEEWLRATDTYYTQSSLYTVAQFLGWEQILRHEVVYLDFTDTKGSKIFEAFLTNIRRGFSQPDFLLENPASAPEESEDKWVYSFGVQSIGDAMIEKIGEKTYVKNYAAFCDNILCTSDKNLIGWLDMLGKLFTNLKKADIRFRRIVAIHCFVNSFINYSDPKHVRTEKQVFYWEYLLPEESVKIKEQIKRIAPNLVLY